MSEYTEALAEVSNLEERLADARARLALIKTGRKYDIALRPDDRDHPRRLDDIVVMSVPMFRAEQMDRDYWWVSCDVGRDGGIDRICWSVTACADPLRIEWVTTEFPANNRLVYEPGSSLGEGSDAYLWQPERTEENR